MLDYERKNIMKSFDEALWDHLVEHHGADRAQVRATTPPRTSRRPVVVGIAATGLAAVGVATVLATSSGPDPTAAGGPRAGGTGGAAHPTTAASGGPGERVDTAYIVQRVKAKVADEVSQDNTASQFAEYNSGEVSSDGTLTLGPKSYEASQYIAPDAVEYDHATWFNTDGSTTFISITVQDPVVDGKQSFSGTYIEQANHTYSQIRTDPSAPGAGKSPVGPTPSLDSSPSQVQQALQSGQVTQMGTPMFNGAQAIALSINAPHYQNILYVDPQTYQPVGQVIIPDHFVRGLSAVGISYWVPATPANIAMAKDDSIPAGYTKVSPSDQTLGNFGSGNSGDSGSGNSGNSGAG